MRRLVIPALAAAALVALPAAAQAEQSTTIGTGDKTCVLGARAE